MVSDEKGVIMNKNKLLITGLVAVLLIIVGLFLVFSNKEYTVTFDTNGGTKVEEIKVKKNDILDSIPTTTRDGYTFLYWTLDEKIFNKDTKITKDITLVAKWQKNDESNTEVKKYVVTFDSDGGSKLDSTEVEEGKKLSVPDEPTKEGYEFIGWTLNDKAYDFETEVTKDITLKATWKKIEDSKKTYTVTFDTDGGNKISSKKVVEGNKVSKPINPTKSGYTFEGWTLNGKTYNFSSKVNSNITLKAVWKKNEDKPVIEVTKYTVTFDTDGGSSISSQTIEEGKTISKPSNPTKSGYTFVGWTLNGSTYDFNSKVNSNITLKAIWNKIEEKKEYTITVSMVDAYSPDRYLTVKENGTAITVSKLMYTDGTEVACAINGTKISVALADITGETSFKVKLTNGTVVTAKVG